MKTWLLGMFAVGGIVSPGFAGTEMLGSFRAVAGDRSARSVWVNPARIGSDAGPSAAVELVWWRTDGVDEFGRLETINAVAATQRDAYGFQYERNDLGGVPSWALAAGRRISLDNGVTFGSTVEYRGGDDSSFDLTVGASTQWSGLDVAAAVEDVFESDTDGAKTPRTWRAGAAYRASQMMGFVAYDLLVVGDPVDDTRHWFSINLDRTRRVRLSYALNTDGDWSASLSLALRKSSLGAGTRRPDEVGPRQDFASWDWRLPGGRRRPVQALRGRPTVAGH